MNSYIVTFFSHYDAIVFCSALKKEGINARMMPVPRRVSSSCGTCVAYDADELSIDFNEHEIEHAYVQTSSGFERL